MARGILRRLRAAKEKVNTEISGHAKRGGLYARGLASEGYAGGYRDALEDVDLMLRGIEPSRDYWRRRSAEIL